MTTHLNVRPDGVAVITLDNPPVNTLASTLVKSFLENMDKCASDAAVKAIVVTGKGNMFCGGAAVDEMSKSKDPSAALGMINNLHGLIMKLDQSKKVTVAAINGMALGGGCEVTLGCHYRIASDAAKIGTPEVLLGILPGAQGTQRIPRLLPLEAAVQMMTSGQPFDMKKAKFLKLVDQVVPKGTDLIQAAAELALSKNGKTRPISEMPPTTTEKVKVIAAMEGVQLQVSKAAKGMPAPLAILDCIKAALFSKTFQEGVDVEMSKFIEMVTSPESASLRNLFFAERAALKVKGSSGAKPVKFKTVGVIGAGLMGGGITMCFIKKGYPVVLKDAKQEWLDAGYNTIKKNYQISVNKGKMKPEKMKQLLGLIKPTISYNDLKDVDLIVEAVPEIMPLKKEVFTELGKVLKPTCIVGTNTSGLDIDEIAESFPRPEKVMGMHFFSPANVMLLLENIKTKKADGETLATGMQMGKIIGKKAVLAGNCDGFIGNRMLGPYSAQSQMMILEGAGIEQVDKAAVKYGMPMGPVSLGDLVGLDLFWKQRKAVGDPNHFTKVSMPPFDMVDWLCENGRTGQKAAKGVYNYDPKTRRKQGIAPEVVAKAAEIQKAKGVTPRAFTDEEIQERLFFPLINEGFKILDEGMAQRPSDIDIVYAYGYGFAAYKGGPMHCADNWIKLPKLLAGLQKYDADFKKLADSNKNIKYFDYFTPSKLLIECVEKKKTLAALWKEKEAAGSKL